MKIAICFYGYFGKTNISRIGRNNLLFGNQYDDYNELWSINHFKKNVIQNYDVDIFFHTWKIDKNTHNILLDNYKPKKFIIEDKNIIAIENTNKYDPELSLKCRYYSESKSTELMLKYQEENNFEYDLVMHTIFDQLFFTKINFENLDKNYIYNSFWNSNNPIKQNNFFFEQKKGIYDQWYISNPEYIKIITNKDNNYKIFEQYPYKKYGGHIQRLKLIEQLKLKDKLTFYYFVGIDHVKCNQIFTPQYRHLLKRCIN